MYVDWAGGQVRCEYISFVRQPAKSKTSVWHCVNNRSGALLGEVKWNGAWRQYCYFPTDGTLYSSGCLNDIARFMKELRTAERGKALAEEASL